MDESINIELVFQSGIVLCQLIKKMYPKIQSIPIDSTKNDYSIHRVIYFLEILESFRVDKTFEIKYLYNENNTKEIIDTIYSFESAARKKG